MSARKDIPVLIDHLRQTYLDQFTPAGQVLLEEHLQAVTGLFETHVTTGSQSRRKERVHDGNV